MTKGKKEPAIKEESRGNLMKASAGLYVEEVTKKTPEGEFREAPGGREAKISFRGKWGGNLSPTL